MNDLVTQSVADRRYTMLVLGAFATVALLLAIVGIYGVVSYAVARGHVSSVCGSRWARRLAAYGGSVLRSAMRAVVPGLVVAARC